jgi:hypothetical protein
MTARQLDDLGEQQPNAARRRVDQCDVARLHRKEVGRERLAVMPCIITAAAVRSSIVSGIGTSDAAGIAIRSAELPGA